jgi:hypothetical protein
VNAQGDDAAGETTTHQLLARALWIAGALLWAYVVIGQLVVQQDLPEPLGLVALIGVIGACWFICLRGGSLAPSLTRTLEIGTAVLAVLFFAASIALAIVIGSHTEENAVTLMLWLLSLIAFFVGRHFPRRHQPPSMSQHLAMFIGLWICAAVATLIALGPVVGNL